jgi:hypothetical protein
VPPPSKREAFLHKTGKQNFPRKKVPKNVRETSIMSPKSNTKKSITVNFA